MREDMALKPNTYARAQGATMNPTPACVSLVSPERYMANPSFMK